MASTPSVLGGVFGFRAGVELVGLVLLLSIVVPSTLAIGQIAAFYGVLSNGSITDLVSVCGLAWLAGAEACLPLIGLLATGLIYGRLQREGAWAAYSALGLGPVGAYIPATLLGVSLALASIAVSQRVGPEALGQLHGRVIALAGANLGAAASAAEGGRMVLGAGDAVYFATATADGVLLGVAERPTLVDASSMAIETGRVAIWSPRLRIAVRSARLKLGDGLSSGPLSRRLERLRGPNAQPSSFLRQGGVHAQFVWHRRFAMGACALPWAVLGAFAGARFGGAKALVLAALAVLVSYWILRTGELNARSGLVPAWWAAWAPVGLLVLSLSLWRHRDPLLP